jgi:CRP/FNR family transcriptional regulator
MTFLSADARIARLLLKNADSGGKVTLTHEEIASEVGVSRVTVSKLLSRFVRDGLIRTSYRRIEVLNRERLREFSGMSTTHPQK